MNRLALLLISILAVPAAAQQPAITGLQNSYSFLLPGLPNYALAQGSIIVVYGSNLAPPGLLLASFNPTLGRTLGGVGVRVTVNGVSTDAIPYYVSPGQLSAILPSATPVGNGTISVSFNGNTSAGFPIQVVPSGFGIMTESGNGLGQAVVMDANYERHTPLRTAREDQTVIFWGTGLGPDPNDETRVIAAPQNLGNLPFEFYIGNKLAEVAYHGRSQYPGLDLVVAKIPRGVGGCYVSVYAKTGNVISNFTTIPVTPDGGVCGEFFVNAQELPGVLGLETVRAGWLYLGKFLTYLPGISAATVTNAANAQFLRQRPFDYTNYGSLSQPSVGNCVSNGFNLRDPFTAPILQTLDPAAVSLTLPNGTTRNLVRDQRSFVLSGGGSATNPEFIPDAGGTFIFRSPGGLDVGSFEAPVTVARPFSWTNRTSITSIGRQRELEITWTGGEAESYVVVTGTSTNQTTLFTNFSCTERVAAGRLVIPRDVLASMLPGAGEFIVFNYRIPVRFAAPGIDIGNISYYTGDVIRPLYQ